MSTVRIEVEGDTARLYSDYSQERIDVIKTIPGRMFHSDAPKHWSVPAAQTESLLRALEAFGDQVLVQGAPQPTNHHDDPLFGPKCDHRGLERERDQLRIQVTKLEAECRSAKAEATKLRSARKTSRDDWAVQLLSGCDPALSTKVFRALARTLHPDTGGNATLMQQLNAARDVVG